MDADYNLYQYDPNLAVAGVALAAFLILGGAIAYQARKYKTKYMYAVVVGAAFEVLGFGLRLWSGQPNNTKNIPAYANSSLFLLLPPIVIALGSYLTVAKIIIYSNYQTKFIRPRIIEKAFLYMDIFCFLVQGGGGGMLAVPSIADIGTKITTAGLVLALISFSTFATVTAYVQYGKDKFTFSAGNSTSRWRILFVVVWINIVALIIRSIYRLVEFAQGMHGYLLTHEVYFYVFDSLMMVIALAAFVIVPPGRYIRPDLIDFNAGLRPDALGGGSRTMVNIDSNDSLEMEDWRKTNNRA
ncbi:hypothetical protein EC973_001218 [Apophysomyces ossiformis]|uniref:RTA1-domain-containing protein n=1 Tax=Apophysomyces ossiformis TaxID=679940 RepID=A0A8H7BKK2_9FUNG|nr:hypothetical protein EC973_001218 [Apophysomyces ossiformis]